MRLYRFELVVCLFLIVATISVFGQVRSHDFLNFDDNKYITENTHVQAGLTWEGFKWAFTTTYANFWHPLTWLSHMLDCQFFGLKSGMHHLSNLLIHMVNSIMLFLILKRMTGALWRSAFVAALFALHPLHVESVVWLSERKDVLSTSFWLLTMWSYIWYVKHPGFDRYLLVFLFFIMGLMAKPMIVTLPFVLLLLDYWPLSRFQFGKSGGFFSSAKERSRALGLVWEKMPFFIAVAACSVVAFFAQQSGGAIGSLDTYSLYVRVANALISYVSYIVKMIWPHHLAVHYPHPGTVPIWQAAGAGLLLVCVSVLVVRAVRKYPYLAVGWLWYLGTLVPVSGLVQVGSHAMADRYTYVPLIGLFILIAWGVSELGARWRYQRVVIPILAGVSLLALMIGTWLQVRHWQNSVALFQHTLDVTANNVKAHNNLGTALLYKGNFKEASAHFSEALRINPNNAALHYNKGLALLRQGNMKEAFTFFYDALRINPNLIEAHRDLGTALLHQGQFAKAIVHLSEVLRIRPNDVEAHNNLGNALLNQGRIRDAIWHYSEVLRIRPDYSGHYNLGLALLRQGQLNEAIKHFSESLRIRPDNVMAHNNLGNALARQGNFNEAVAHYSEALRIKPDFVDAHINIGIVLKRQGKVKEAIRHFSEALRIQPDNRKARLNLQQGLQLMDKSAQESNTGVKP